MIPYQRTFRDAVLYHLERTQMSQADLVRISGVSPNVVKKLLHRDNATTAVENGIAIAAAFGLSVEKFVALEEPSEMTLAERVEALPPHSRQFVEMAIDLATLHRKTVA